MQPAVSHQLLDRFALGFVVVLLASLVTYVEIAQPSWLKVQSTAIQSPSSSTTPKAQALTRQAAAPAPKVKTATTASYVNLRAQKSTSSQIIGNLEAGMEVQLRDDSNSTWQGVTYQGKNGYIYKSYLQYPQ